MNNCTARQHECIVCGSITTRPVLTIDAVPVYCNVVHDTRDQALQAATGKIALRYCQNCDHLFNACLNADLLRYTDEYNASLHYSRRFRVYAEAQVDYLLQRYQLDGKRVLEIACGKGNFLHMLAAKCRAEFIGIDPSFESRDKLAENITVVSEYFDPNVHAAAADLIICRQALEHIDRPTDFLRHIAANLPNSQTTQVYFEVPNSLFSLRDLSIWDFIYEHVSYFSQDSLRACFAAAGFAVVAVRETYGGQYLCIECEYPATDVASSRKRGAAQYVQHLAAAYCEKLAFWNTKLRSEAAATVVWGAGSKGVTFLNLVASAAEITYVVDLNPRKKNKFIAGTGQRVIAPEQLQQLAVQRVLVMNPLYLAEIETMLAQLGVVVEVVVV